MKMMRAGLGGIAGLMLAATAIPAGAQQAEPTTGLSYCSRNVTDNCIQRVDIKRHGGVKQAESSTTSTTTTTTEQDSGTDTTSPQSPPVNAPTTSDTGNPGMTGPDATTPGTTTPGTMGPDASPPDMTTPRAPAPAADPLQ